VMEHKREVAERVRSHCRTAIVAPNKAREAADAQWIRIADINGIAALSESGN